MTAPSIIFEDEYLVVINKQAGLTVNKSETTNPGETVQEWHGKRFKIQDSSISKSEFIQKGGVVHRLDRDTSGVMVLAKTSEAYEGLKSQFLERTTEKKYVALVHGLLKDKEGVIALPIVRHPVYRKMYSVGEDPSRTAITDWKVLNQYSKDKIQYSMVELVPHTGRTHQLRVHMKHLGHPIVGDLIYGFKKKLKDDLEWCPRMFLHAKYLKLVHPITGETREFEAELTKELLNVSDLLHLE